MTTRTFATLLVVALLVVPGFSSAVGAGSHALDGRDAAVGPDDLAVAQPVAAQADDDSVELEVVAVDSSASVGATGTVAVTVEHTGDGTANDARLSLTAGGAEVTFGKTAVATRYLGTWEPGERKTVRYSVRTVDTAQAGEYPFTLAAAYEDSDGRDRRTRNQTFGIEVGPEQSFAVGDVTSTLQVGDDGQLSGELTNTGNRTVEDVVLTWASEQQNVHPTETEYAVGSLEPGESAGFDFDVEVSDAARSGPRQFSLVAEYEDDQGNQQSSDPIAVRQEIGAENDEFAVDVVHANVSAGGQSTIELELTNTANETLTDVSAKLFADSPISTTDDEAYVPSLEHGESTTLVFGISVGGAALEKDYPLSMDFQYDEPDGDTVTSDTYLVPVRVTRSDGGGLPLGLAGGVGLLVLVGIGAFVRFR